MQVYAGKSSSTGLFESAFISILPDGFLGKNSLNKILLGSLFCGNFLMRKSRSSVLEIDSFLTTIKSIECSRLGLATANASKINGCKRTEFSISSGKIFNPRLLNIRPSRPKTYKNPTASISPKSETVALTLKSGET